MKNSTADLIEKTMIILMLGSAVLVPASYAQEKTAEELVASMRKADMSYKQLMQIFGKSLSNINDGIILENKQMVIEGVNFILGHPAPKQKPWNIMEKADQDTFKKTLVAFDQILDEQAKAVSAAAKKLDWLAASEATRDLAATCISCHFQWKSKVK